MGYMLSGAGGFSCLILVRQKDVLCPNYKGASVTSFDVLCRPDLRENKSHAVKLHGKVDSNGCPFLTCSVHIHEQYYHSEECMSFRFSEEVG